MTTLIDYFSFTVPWDVTTITNQTNLHDKAHSTLTKEVGVFWYHIFEECAFYERSGRGSYRYGFESVPVGFYIWFGPTASEILVEVTGQGCEWLRQRNLLEIMIIKMRNRTTRLDVATDFNTDVTPSEFVDAGHSGRFRSHGFQTSESGETHYIGSRTSDRYAKVYRYAPPHPRSQLLRVEHTFKKDYAKVASNYLEQHGLIALAESAGTTWEWGHCLWSDTMKTTEKIPGYKQETKAGKTLRWILTQVAPAIKKLIEDGTIPDPQRFFEEHFMPDQDNPERPTE